MPKEHARRHVRIETDLSKTSAAEGSAHERMKARPDAGDLTDPKEVWKDAERTPDGERTETSNPGYSGRVADAGDVGGGQASPYGTPAQADALARQTNRTNEPRGVEKPKRG